MNLPIVVEVSTHGCTSSGLMPKSYKLCGGFNVRTVPSTTSTYSLLLTPGNRYQRELSYIVCEGMRSPIVAPTSHQRRATSSSFVGITKRSGTLAERPNRLMFDNTFSI